MQLYSRITILLPFIFISLFVYSQDNKDKNDFTIKLTGYVKYDMFYDSRQTVDAREGHLLMWPKNIELDENGKDINARGSFNFLSIQSRLALRVTGPSVFNAKTSALIEGEFFGHTNADINGFRLRHAIMKFDWNKSELLMGQYWHPLFILGCFPGTVSFNTGIGFQPFARNPQIKYTYKFGLLHLSYTAFTERDFPSRGIDGSANSSYVRNTGIPSMNLNLNYSNKSNSPDNYITTGFAVNYKTMLPQMKTIANYITNQKVNAFSAIAYFNKRVKNFECKFAATYGENTTDFLMLGGFAVLDTVNFETKEISYIPLRNVSAWVDFSTTGKVWQIGLFAGYNKNIGASKDFVGNISGFYNNINYLYRISPRVNYYVNKIQIGAELEYTAAAFGDGRYTSKGIPLSPKEVGNLRVILGIYYNF